jgi:hypothetical protein
VKSALKIPVKVYLPADLARALGELAVRRRRTKSELVQAAVASYLSPDASERLEAALARRLDRLSRQLDRLERDQTLSNEALALVARFLFSVMPPLPDAAQAAAQAKGRERYDGFVETLGRRLAKGQSFAREVLEDRLGTPGAEVGAPSVGEGGERG